MNTDNMTVSGETIDFGPCAFLDVYDPAAVFSSIDHAGRYAYENQPRIAQWNLARLAETLLPLIDEDADRAVELATASVSGFSHLYQDRWLAVMRAKLGLRTPLEGDAELARDWLEVMRKSEVDFTLGFRRLCDAADSASHDSEVRSLFGAPSDYDRWAAAWRLRLAREPDIGLSRCQAMRAVNPAVIPRNHRIEEIIAAATDDGDFQPFHEMSRVLETPYVLAQDDSPYADPPRPDERVTATFCGT